MKIWFVLFILIQSNVVLSQQHVVLSPKTCQEGYYQFRDWSFKLTYPNKEQKEVPLIYGETFSTSLIPGAYEMEYESVYGNKEKHVFVVDHQDTATYFYCVDKLTLPESDTFTSIIEHLAEEDTYELFFTSGGCFHNERDSVSIRNIGNQQLEATLDGKSIRLNDHIISILVKMEKVLKYVRIPGECTMQDTYLLTLNGEKKLGFSDRSCRWGAFLRLKHELEKLE